MSVVEKDLHGTFSFPVLNLALSGLSTCCPRLPKTSESLLGYILEELHQHESASLHSLCPVPTRFCNSGFWVWLVLFEFEGTPPSTQV